MIAIEFLFETSVCVCVWLCFVYSIGKYYIEISDQYSTVCRNYALLQIERMETVMVNVKRRKFGQNGNWVYSS